MLRDIRDLNISKLTTFETNHIQEIKVAVKPSDMQGVNEAPCHGWSIKDTNQDHHPQSVPALTYGIHDLYFNSFLTFLSVTNEIKHKHTFKTSGL